MPALVPAYLQDTHPDTASPGLRFGMFFSAWQADFSIGKDSKVKTLKTIGQLNEHKATMQAIARRQNELAENTANMLTLDAFATAPFTTGLGNEHPLENGFAFLNPYGLPYLPGSGIKGVLRQAARELASGDWGDTRGWSGASVHAMEIGRKSLSLSTLDILFGKESEDGDSEHLRGVLSFWDALPVVAGDSLAVDVMTPHQSHYYQDGKTPHDSGQPNPITFLTLPPGTRFTFHVRCDLVRLRFLAPELARDEHWQSLLNAAFQHAFAWLGFGAKTAVGYGAMVQLTEEQLSAAKAEAQKSPWVEEKIADLVKTNRSNPDEVLRGKALAEAWQAIEDPEIKASALADIQRRWQAKNWWDTPPGKASRQAKAAYLGQ